VVQALLFSGVSVSVALAASVDELVAFSGLDIVVPLREIGSAHSWIGLAEARLYKGLSGGGTLCGSDAASVLGLDVSFITVASGVAHENTGTRGVSVVLAGEGTSGTARLVVLVLAAFFSSDVALFWSDTSSVVGSNVSVVTMAPRVAHLVANERSIFVVGACQGTSRAARVIVFVLTTLATGESHSNHTKQNENLHGVFS